MTKEWSPTRQPAGQPAPVAWPSKGAEEEEEEEEE
jgi:hypothetical protein